VVADKLEVCGTYNRKQMNPLYRGVKRLSTNSAVWAVQPFLFSTTPQKCTFDRRREDLSGRTARLTMTSQDQPTVSHRGSSRTRGVYGNISVTMYFCRLQRFYHASQCKGLMLKYTTPHSGIVTYWKWPIKLIKRNTIQMVISLTKTE